ncbi:CRISPR-associated primase-polymerase type A1 [Desulfobulbus alkaliphilus]|uniref:CRISPR-associated primase-polymerase type A1 n=1 Tax=Desulfobulbus alkaliphilus TaxID=869814 RepID=UPI0019626A22|nr:CRISPR-associated primase-polymerase type A1 [Desulfobulbus alkaliphilus]MBM9536309.1 DNA primase [Desulfobulbus alkaliphilus]
MALQQPNTDIQAIPRQDHRLLLDRINKASFDDAGQAFVRRAFSGEVFWDGCDDDEILGLALVAQQHGLFDQALIVLSWLNRERPQSVRGWQAHVELHATLGQAGEAAKIAARAQRFVPAAQVRQWEGVAAAQSQSGGAGETKEEENILEPFARLRRLEEDLGSYMALFRGREEAFARQWADREEGKQGYVPVQRPMQPEDVREHIQGKRTYGIYLLTGASQVWTGVVDVDLVTALRDRQAAEKEKAVIRRESAYIYTRIMELASAAGLTCLGEISGGKGYHFWFPVDQPVAAADMRTALKVLLGALNDDLRCFSLEVFPKQDRLTGKGYGNLVKLPLGIHRVTGRKSSFVGPKGRSEDEQLAWLRTQRPGPAKAVAALVERQRSASIVVHPRLAAWAEQFPELAELEAKCTMLGQIIAMARGGKPLSVREEKIVLGTIGHLPRGRLLLHHLFARLPDYNRPLLDFKISRVRGTVLGCKRIHSLLDQAGGSDLPCTFSGSGYPHPLLHLRQGQESPAVQEKVVNLKDALLSLKTAIVQVERFL